MCLGHSQSIYLSKDASIGKTGLVASYILFICIAMMIFYKLTDYNVGYRWTSYIDLNIIVQQLFILSIGFIVFSVTAYVYSNFTYEFGFIIWAIITWAFAALIRIVRRVKQEKKKVTVENLVTMNQPDKK